MIMADVSGYDPRAEADAREIKVLRRALELAVDEAALAHIASYDVRDELTQRFLAQAEER
jgi:hypothetical protein